VSHDSGSSHGSSEPPGLAHSRVSSRPEASGGAEATPETELTGRRLVEIRCGFAEMARVEAEAAAKRVMEAKRLYDDRAASVARALGTIDPASTWEAKEAAHRDFRTVVAAAHSHAQVEAAASAWLKRINDVNRRDQVAQTRLRRAQEEAEAQLAELTRLADVADTSATMAEAAMEACRAAAAALTRGEAAARQAAPSRPGRTAPMPGPQAAATAQAGSGPAPLHLVPPVVTTSHSQAETAVPSAAAAAAAAGTAPLRPPVTAEDLGYVDQPSTDSLAMDLRAPEPQLITLLMRRDRRTLAALVERLAGPNVAERSRWQLLLSTFVDAVAAAAIEDAWFDFPADHPFWSQFTRFEARELVRSMAALGFRYDGLGGFVDGRVPRRRELVMAAGGAGLLPVRVRCWPNGEEAALLFRDVVSAADTFLAARSPSLTLGELVRLLGRRAKLLADLWNEWPRVRPLLFQSSL
jgi:hypothetical protein